MNRLLDKGLIIGDKKESELGEEVSIFLPSSVRNYLQKTLYDTSTV